jgi:CheY-like chemotaxis protein
MATSFSKSDPIVVVIDDDDARSAMQGALLRAGYLSVIATDAAGALSRLQQTPEVPATIMLDAGIRMKVLRALLGALAAVPRLARVPIYLIDKLERPPRQFD